MRLGDHTNPGSHCDELVVALAIQRKEAHLCGMTVSYLGYKVDNWRQRYDRKGRKLSSAPNCGRPNHGNNLRGILYSLSNCLAFALDN
jgi:hypothetical protein